MPARYDAVILKYLRIAVTALSLTACMLLIALWVRSYHLWENIHALPGGRGVVINSFAGLMSLGFGAFEPQGAWNWVQIEATEPAKTAGGTLPMVMMSGGSEFRWEQLK